MDNQCDVKDWAKTLLLSFLAVSTVLYLLEPDMIMKIDEDGNIIICYRKLFSVAMMIAIVITITSVCIEGVQKEKEMSSVEMSFPRSKPSKLSSKIKTY